MTNSGTLFVNARGPWTSNSAQITLALRRAGAA